MELICYLHPGWDPMLRPAEPTRDWMDASPETFAYRCLPLNIANAHGWEMLSPCGFEACWNGGGAPGDVTLRLDAGADPQTAPVALFGQGVLTFHIYGLFRTEPGWNLWIGGSPNRPKDGIYPLTGVMETDWAPFTFTMNWRFTRPDNWIRFEKGEPICFVFPVQRGYLETTTPKLVPLDADPGLRDRFKAWSRSRNDFGAKVKAETPTRPSARWQKHYFRGIDVDGVPGADDHCTKLRPPPFLPASEAPRMPALEPPPAPSRPAPPVEEERPRPDPPPVIIKRGDADALAASAMALRKREWLLETIDAHRRLSLAGQALERRTDLSREAFFEDYYARHRPVILAGEMADWPALSKWTASYLRAQVGDRMVEYQGDRDGAPNYEPNKVAHRRRATFDAFMDQVERSRTGNDAYLTAFNSATNAEIFAPLMVEVGRLEKFLAYDRAQNPGMPWIGGAGSFTPLHHDLTNNLIAQVAGRKQFKIVSALSVGQLKNYEHVFSDFADLDRAPLCPQTQAASDDLIIHTVTLSPGEIIFLPIGWWHQVRAIDFSISLTFTNFHWKNDFYGNYPRA